MAVVGPYCSPVATFPSPIPPQLTCALGFTEGEGVMVVASFVGTTGIIGVTFGVTDGVGLTELPLVDVGFTLGGVVAARGNCARHSPGPPPAVIHSENVVGFFFATGATVGVAGGGLHVAPPKIPDDPFAH